MNKTYITAISLQGRSGLEKGIYKPEGFSLEKNVETSFPIVPILANTAGNVEDVKIIALRTNNLDVKDNYKAFVEEVYALGIKEEQVHSIYIEENQSKKTGLAALVGIIEAIPEDSLLYADITYGTKPMSALVLYAMNCIEKIKDTEVEGIFYGELPRQGGTSMWERAKLYDLTAYKFLTDVVEQLRGLEVTDIESALKNLIDL